MVEITMMGGTIVYFDGSAELFASYVRSAHARGSATLEVHKEKGLTTNLYIVLTNVDHFIGI